MSKLRGQVSHTRDGSIRVHGLHGRWAGWSFLIAVTLDNGEFGAVQAVAPEGEWVSAEVWRLLPIGSVLDLARDTLTPAVVSDRSETQRRPRHGSEAHRQLVADLYREALAMPGTRTVPSYIAQVLEVSEKTANRYIAEARDTEPPLLHDYPTERTRAERRRLRESGQALPISPEALDAFYAEHHRRSGRVRAPRSSQRQSSSEENS